MVSIIIVNYKVKKQLFACIQSIISSAPKSLYEIIVVDNDESKMIKKDLLKTFPKVTYISNKNKGYGQGNNVGAQHAKGEYLFFLNPDTKFLSNCIDSLSEYLKKNRKIGLAAPLLYDKENKPYALQGSRELTPLYAIFNFSLLSKIFPNNYFAKKYWMKDKLDKHTSKEVDAIPGTAFMIKKSIFDSIQGFDEKFFLFFEESDLCKRVKKEGHKIVILSTAKLLHTWGESTKRSKKDINKIFLNSRFYYLKKHFGFLTAFFTEAILRISKYVVLLTAILVIGLFLRIYLLYETMPFIGDQGWFYLSARDLVLYGTIPLVGIESSHPWIHQGALWTYLLALWFKLFSFHPVSAGYLTALLDVFAIVIMYKLTSAMFSQRIGILSAALYASSPLVILTARMPYHTSIIPLFILIYIFLLYKWLNGRKYFFPLLILCLAILYNLELATFLFSFVTGCIVLYGIMLKEKWAREIFTKKILVGSFLAFIVGMLPMLIHDLSHQFSQTLKFLVWIGYRILVFFGYPQINPTAYVSFNDMVGFFSEFYENLILPTNSFVALGIVLGSFLVTTVMVLQTKKEKKNLVIIYIINLLLLAGIFIAKTPSGAYLTLLFPTSLILIAIFLDQIFKKRRLQYFLYILIISIIGLNSYFLVSHRYSFNQSYHPFPKRLEIAKYIVKESNGKEYNLITEGKDKTLPNFSMNYNYLTWWLGHPPSQEKQKLLFVVEEKSEIIKIRKEILQ